MDTKKEDKEPGKENKEENKEPDKSKKIYAWALFWGSALAYLAVWGYIFTIFNYAVSSSVCFQFLFYHLHIGRAGTTNR